jgi:hypothetical protein
MKLSQRFRTALIATMMLMLSFVLDMRGFAQANSSHGVKNIVLVHGAWADGSCWSKVIPLLQAKGFHVVAVQNPLTSLADDVAATNDFIGRESRSLADGGTFETGKYRFRCCRTPHLPHGWDAGVLFEETERTLLCSDLFHQNGDVEPLSSADLVGRSHQAMKEYQAGILADYVPYTPQTALNLKKLVDLKPRRSPSCMAPASPVTAPKRSMI